MSLDIVASATGGLLVIAVPVDKSKSNPLLDWIFRHHETKEETEEAAKGFAA